MSSSKKFTNKGLCGRCLSEFIGDTVSHVGIFDPCSFVNVGSLLLSLVQLSPPLPCVNKFTVNKYTVKCVRGGGYGVLGHIHINTQRVSTVNFNKFYLKK
jgi:hypothetical protein